MRKLIGIIVLLLGWITLGLIGSGNILTDFSFGKNAVQIENYIAGLAKTQIGRTTYNVKTLVSGRDIQITGIVENNAEKARILGRLAATHGHRRVVDDLKLIDTASPYVFRGIKNADHIVFRGNAPTRQTLESIIGSADNNLTLAGGMPDAKWPSFVETGIRGISMLENGAFEISDRHIVVSGLAQSFDEQKSVTDIFATLPVGYTAKVDLDVAPTVPYTFNGTKAGDSETYTGYVPSKEARAEFTNLIGTAAEGLKPAAGLPDDNWLSVVAVGIKALKSLNEGQLKGVDKRVEVTGSVNTPDAVSSIESLFAVLPDGYSKKVNLTSEDDGTPARLSFEWTSHAGGTINGKGPEGVSMDDLTAALKLPSLGGIFREGSVVGKDTMMPRLNGIGKALPLLESAETTLGVDHVLFSGVLLPGGNMEFAQTILTAALGDDVQLTLTRSTLEPTQGDRRVNVDTDKTEVFQNGFWKVVLKDAAEPELIISKAENQPEAEDVNPTLKAIEISKLKRCKRLSSDIMSTVQITYETASANLTTGSRSALTELANAMAPCAGINGLNIEIGGHTDSQGSEEFNQTLSQERADSVRTTLVTLGVNQSAISAIGFGETVPIAPNDTKVGRAQNRRTTFTWVNR